MTFSKNCSITVTSEGWHVVLTDPAPARGGGVHLGWPKLQITRGYPVCCSTSGVEPRGSYNLYTVLLLLANQLKQSTVPTGYRPHKTYVSNVLTACTTIWEVEGQWVQFSSI